MATNRLSREKSPYLQQHAHNPVDWHSWGNEAFERAHRENRPIFLSIGYATCHWCHVMEKESFEDPEAAAHLNDTFICIKVDREERPDIDTVYMAACQMMTGGGGWPLTIFMTPDKKPFFAGTYIPKHSRLGRTGLLDLCRRVHTMWRAENGKVVSTADNIAAAMQRAFLFENRSDPPTDRLLQQAYFKIEGGFDARYGGFETAPKFPTPHRLLFLLRHHHRHPDSKALEMTEKTLTAMRLGGIWDHIGHGFHRYSTDQHWLLPHFEKMLYDQALIALPYLECYQMTKDPFYAQTAREIFAYVLRDMTSPEGAFYTAEDADSEGEEGRFYVWQHEEFIQAIGGPDAGRWAQVFNLSPAGNFNDEATGRRTGANIPHLRQHLAHLAETASMPAESLVQKWERVRQRLFALRETRVHPLKDDKVLTDWNGLMIAALARGGRVLADSAYIAAAEKAMQFNLKRMRKRDGRLMHRFRDQELAIEGQASDYAFLICGLLELVQSSFDPLYLKEAVALQKQMQADFWDRNQGGFFLTSAAAQDLPVRPKELYDGAIPSANSVALQNLLRLSRLTGNPSFEDRAHQMMRAFTDMVKRQPTAFTYFLLGLDFALHGGQEVVITGKPEGADTQQLLSALNLTYLPDQVTLLKSDQNARQLADLAGYTDGLQVIEGRATAHVCKGSACQESTSDATDMLAQLLNRSKDS